MSFEYFILSHEPAIRLGFFLGIFTAIALWEALAPARALTVSKLLRWASNLGLVALNTVVLRLLFPAAAVGMASFASQQGWGLLNFVALPFWLAAPLAVVALDFVIWLQHVMFHAVPTLWRLHRVHHSIEDDEANSNFGFNLPWWDRAFGTYRDQPRAGHQGMTIGIRDHGDLREVARLPGMLLLPFRGEIKDYAINRRGPSDRM